MITEPTVVLDASAVLAWVLNEKGANTVARMLPVAVLPVSALVETLYRAVEKGTDRPSTNCTQTSSPWA